MQALVIIMFTACLLIIDMMANFNASHSSVKEQCWSSAAKIPTARIELAGVALDEEIYLIAGYTDEPSNLVEVYNSASDEWSIASPLPERLDHLAAAAYNGKIYVVGGFKEDSTPSDRLFIYDPAADEWKEGASMPTARGALTAEFVGGILYAVGGDGTPANIDGMYDPSGQVSINEAYNPEADSWTKKAPMLVPRHHHVSAESDGKLYEIGGRYGISPYTYRYNNTAANEMYDPKKDTWVAVEPMLTARSGAAAASVNGTVYVVGGENNNYPTEGQRTYNTNEKYDPVLDKWTTEPPMSVPRHGLSAVAVNSTIYVIGGGEEPGTSTSDANETFNIDGNGDTCL